MSIDSTSLIKEVIFNTSRSGGAGGQHVNKVESRVSLYWNPSSSNVISEGQRERLKRKLAYRLSKDGFIQLDASDTRSQIKNKEIVIARFLTLIEQALKTEKKRVPTSVPKSEVLNRLDRKRRNSLKKSSRGKIDLD